MALFPKANEISIATLVDRFYDKVRADAELGPIFNAAVHDWTEHTHTLRDFWSSVILRTGRYHGNPMGVHRALPAFPQMLFHRWLELWRETAREVFEPQAAELFIGTAERIAQSISMGTGHGKLAPEHPSKILGPLHIAS